MSIIFFNLILLDYSKYNLFNHMLPIMILLYDILGGYPTIQESGAAAGPNYKSRIQLVIG